MDKNDLEYFRQLLENELSRLLDNAGTAVFELISTTAENEPDPLDWTARELDLNSRYRIRSRESRLIKKIKDSLNAIEDESYGICEDCEEPISMERLKARPVTRFCIACKMRRERYEKAIGY
jgi:DnaK suppressor protein